MDVIKKVFPHAGDTKTCAQARRQLKQLGFPGPQPIAGGVRWHFLRVSRVNGEPWLTATR